MSDVIEQDNDNDDNNEIPTQFPTNGLVAQVSGVDIALWSESKKSDFSQTFKDRVRVGQYVLLRTAELVAVAAVERQYASAKHSEKMLGGNDLHQQQVACRDTYVDAVGSKRFISPAQVGGRSLASLEEIASTRAEQTLAQLPALKKAVMIIDPDTAKKMAEIERLKLEGQELLDQLNEVSRPIMLEEQDQTMTLGKFRQMVEELSDTRLNLLKQMGKIAKKGTELEVVVAKRLYAGLPGLTDAVITVVRHHIDQAKALEATGRRVEEQVKFGDSEAALSLLRHFESDEIVVSDAVQQQFAGAMQKLKDAVKRGSRLAGTKKGA